MTPGPTSLWALEGLHADSCNPRGLVIIQQSACRTGREDDTHPPSCGALRECVSYPPPPHRAWPACGNAPRSSSSRNRGNARSRIPVSHASWCRTPPRRRLPTRWVCGGFGTSALACTSQDEKHAFARTVFTSPKTRGSPRLFEPLYLLLVLIKIDNATAIGTA